MSENLKDFFFGFGFKLDTSSQAKVEAATAATEKKVTAAAEVGAAKRVEVEQGASGKRLTFAEAMGRILVGMEQDRAAKAAKIRQDEATKDEKLQAERERKAKERRAAAVKEMQAHATRMVSFALKSVAAIEATALGIVYATDKAAKSMERLGYASQRAGSTPGKMTATSYAFSQLGSTAEAGEAAVRSVGDRLKTNPQGYASALKSIGIEARNAKGEIKDASDVTAELGDAFARMRKEGPLGYAKAKSYAGMWGLDDDQMQTMSDPRYRKMLAEQQAIDAKTGTNRGDAATAGTAFEQSMRKLEAVVDSVKAKVETGLFKTLQPELDKLSAWGEAHGEQLAAIFARIAKDIVAFAQTVTDQLAKVDWDGVLGAMEKFGKEFDAKSKAIFGENGPIIVTLAAFGALIGSKVLGPLNLVLGTLRTIGGLPLVGRLLAGGVNPATAAVATAGVAAAATAEMADRTTKAMQSGDPNAKFDPETGFVNDLDFGYGDKPAGGSPVGGSLWDKLKSMVGLGPSDPDARKVKDAIIATSEGVKKLADGGGLSAGAGTSGVTASSGGLGGSGQHLSGDSAPGATVGDRAHGRRTGAGGGAGPIDGNLPVGNVPGASGYGLTNAYWRGPLDKRGEGGFTGPREMFDYLKSQGASDNEALLLTGAASSESSFNPNAKHDPDPRTGQFTGHGLFGHKDTRLDMRGKNWQQQSVLALGELRRMLGSRVNAARTPEELADLEMHYEGPRGYHRNTPRSGDNYMGRLNSIRRFSVMTGRPAIAATASAPSPAGTSAAAVSDAEVFAARQRILNGGRDPKDQALVERYKAEQAKPVKVDVTDASAAKIGKARMSDETRQHLQNVQTVLRARHGNVLPFLHPHAHLSSAARTAIDNSRHRQIAMTHNPTFNINGGDHSSMLAEAHRTASRGAADLVRNMSVMES